MIIEVRFIPEAVVTGCTDQHGFFNSIISAVHSVIEAMGDSDLAEDRLWSFVRRFSLATVVTGAVIAVVYAIVVAAAEEQEAESWLTEFVTWLFGLGFFWGVTATLLLLSWRAKIAKLLRPIFFGWGQGSHWVYPHGVALQLRPETSGLILNAYPRLISTVRKKVLLEVIDWQFEINGHQPSKSVSPDVPFAMFKSQWVNVFLPPAVVPELTDANITEELEGVLRLAVSYGREGKKPAGALAFEYKIWIPRLSPPEIRVGKASMLIQTEMSFANLERVKHGTVQSIVKFVSEWPRASDR